MIEIDGWSGGHHIGYAYAWSCVGRALKTEMCNEFDKTEWNII